MFGGDASDDEDGQSIAPSMKHRQEPSSPVSPIHSTRGSVMSMRELEFGWSTNASGVRQQQSRGSPLASPTTPSFAGPPPKAAYRPVFAPAIDPFEDEATETVAELRQDEPQQTGLAPPVELKRGRSLKDRVTDAIRGRSKSMSHATHAPSPPIPSPKLDDKWAESAERRPQPVHRTSEPEKTSWAADIVRRVSRRRTTNAPRHKPENDMASYRTMMLQSRISRIDLRATPEVADIRLYAAPASANVPDAPALSSYAPRPPLRPRAQSDTSVSEAPAATVVRSNTVAEAAAEYRARRSKTTGSKSSSQPVRKSMPSSPDGSIASRRASRRPRVVPEGWSTREDVAGEAASEDKAEEDLKI